MNNHITKMRIIHTAEYNAEAEYIKTFFEFIGILVYDEIIYNKEDWYESLNKHNDYEGVDIVLNYYGSENYYTPYYENRFYLHFCLEEYICKVQDEYLNDYFASNNDSKRNTRINVLNELINNIWKNDEESKQSILQIREYYVPQEEDNDLFYNLQAIYCTDTLLNLSYIKQDDEIKKKQIKECEKKGLQLNEFYNKYVLNITSYLSEYIPKMFFELWRIICSLKENDNPYIIYTTINAYKQLLILYSHLYKYEFPKILDIIEYNNQKIEFKNLNQLKELTNNLLCRYPKFTKGLFLKAELNDMEENSNIVILKHLINESKTKLFPAYYAAIYQQLGILYIKNDYTNEGNELLKQSFDINPYNFNVLYDKAYFYALNATDGNFTNAEVITNYILNYIPIKDNHNYLSLENYILIFKIYILRAKMFLKQTAEYSLKEAVNCALLTTECIGDSPLIGIIADENEEAYNTFIEYMKNSTPIWNLYNYLEPLINDVSKDNYSRNILKKELSRWTDTQK